MRHGYAVSDLHLFTHWSAAGRIMPAVHAAAANADFLVLNGDIFDFRWSTLATVEQTVSAATDWLESLAAAHPRCRVVYLMGNHDRLAAMTGPLEALAGRRENFLWHASHARIHGALFLHGDLALRKSRPNPFHRPLRDRQWKPGRTARLAYNSLVVGMGVHRLAGRFNPPEHCARRILDSMRRHDEGWSGQVRDVYFGHTHRPFADFEYEGVRFHNTGSAVHGMKSNLLRVRV